MDNKFSLIFISILFAFCIFPIGVNAEYYRPDVDNGSWSSYYAGLEDQSASSLGYYTYLESGMVTYDRDFETEAINLSLTECSTEWCIGGSGGLNSAETIGTDFYNGTKSFKADIDTSQNVYLFSKDEIVGDSNITFFYKTNYSGTNGNFYWGYTDDTNKFYQIGTIADEVSTWTQASYVIPAGHFRPMFYIESGSGSNNYFLIDYIAVRRNNIGTYRVNSLPDSCSSIEGCSNIKYHLPASNLKKLYWVADYVAGATCIYNLNKAIGSAGSDGFLTEGLNGMYYLDISSAVSSGTVADLNIEASCSKSPYNSKSFIAQPKINKYGNLTGGNFETDFDLALTECLTDWCIAGSGGLNSAGTVNTDLTEGGRSFKLSIGTPQNAHIFSQDTDLGGSTISFDYKFYFTGAGSPNFYWGSVDDANAFTQIGSIGTAVSTWARQSFDLPIGTRPAFYIESDGGDPTYFLLDNVVSTAIKETSSLSVSNSLISNVGLKATTYNFYADYVDEYDTPISSGDCNISIGSSDYSMVYNATSGKFEYSKAFIVEDTYSVKTECGSDGYNSQDDTYSIKIRALTSDVITFNPIENINSYAIDDFSDRIDILIGNNQDDVIFSILADDDATPDYYFDMYKNNEQYGIYESSDGSNWVFSESLTYGYSTSYNDPVQKIPNSSGYYTGSFSADLTSGVLTYYKMKPYTIPIYFNTLQDNSEWVHFNQPTIYNDANNFVWDLFQDSNYSNIRSESRKYIPELTTTDFNVGLEFQFTAYASVGTDLEIGYTYNGTDVTKTITLTTDKVTYSVPVAPSDFESHLLIKSSSTTSARIYITDYSIIPKAYFIDRLNVYDRDGSDLKAILYGGESDIYVQEGVPIIIQTSAYDREGDLKTLRIESLIGSTVVRTYDFDLSEATEEDNLFIWRESLEAIIDLSGSVVSPSGFRSATFKAILINTAGQEVSEQFKTVRLMQFPFYPNDIGLALSSLNNKVGTNPKIQFLMNTLNPNAIIGLELKIYDTNHSVNDPNFSQNIYSNEIGCSNYVYCTKNIYVDNWVWEQATNYTVRLTTLLNTETTNYNNNLTSKFITVSATSGTLETARLLQVYERRADADKSYYTQVEPIPLVFQARDDLLRNLQDDMLPYIQIDYYADHVTKDAQTTKFYPIKHYYDNSTGYNYWFWNRYFYLDSGDIFDTNSQIDFKVTVDVSNDTISDTDNYSLGNKCLTYPSKYNPATFLMDWSGRSALDDFDCTTNNPSSIVLYGASQRIDINSSYVPKSGQTQNVLCVRANEPFNPRNDFGDDFACAVLITKSEEQINTIDITIGNDASDVGVTGGAKQYMDFEFAVDDLLFNDVWATATTLTAPNGVESVGNIGDLLYLGFSEIIPSAMDGYDNFSDWFATASFQKNTAFDTNFFANIHFLSSVAFFKVRGLKIINQYDYLNYDPEIQSIPASKFLTYAQSKNLYVPIKKSQIEVYGSNLEPIRTEIIDSPLVISLRPSQTGYSEDENGIRIIQDNLQNIKITITSDMTSANQTKSNRIYLPMVFGYAVPYNPSFFDILSGVGDAINNPVPAFTEFFTQYWFSIIMLIVFALVVSLIYANLRSRNGGTTIVNNPFNRGDSL